MRAAPPAALVTGASRGIGAALAVRLAARGPVIATARQVPVEAQGLDWVTLDVTDPAGFDGLARHLDGRPCGLVVCNAGLYPDKGQNLADGYPAAMWAETFAVNVTGVFLTVQAMLPSLQAAAGLHGVARVAVIASQMGSTTRAPGGSYIYRASKAAAVNLARNLATDLAGLGIAVGAYHPGWVRTDMGGSGAEIPVSDSAEGLIARFDALDLDNTGCFETWDGRAHAY